jgi:hypothetical protein
MEKLSLQSRFFPAKISFSKMQKKNLAGKIYFAKERGTTRMPQKWNFSGNSELKFMDFEKLGVQICVH